MTWCFQCDDGSLPCGCGKMAKKEVEMTCETANDGFQSECTECQDTLLKEIDEAFPEGTSIYYGDSVRQLLTLFDSF